TAAGCSMPVPPLPAEHSHSSILYFPRLSTPFPYKRVKKRWKPWGFHLGVNVYCFVSVERGRGPAPLHVRFQPSGLVGTLPAGGSFCSVKRNQNPLRAFPPKDLPGVRGWAYVKSKFGPSPLLWRLVLPPHQAALGSWPYG